MQARLAQAHGTRPLCRGCGRDLQRSHPGTLTDLCYWCAQRAVAAERLAFLERVRRHATEPPGADSGELGGARADGAVVSGW